MFAEGQGDAAATDIPTANDASAAAGPAAAEPNAEHGGHDAARDVETGSAAARYAKKGCTSHKQVLDFDFSGTALEGVDCMAFWRIIVQLLRDWALPGRVLHHANQTCA